MAKIRNPVALVQCDCCKRRLDVRWVDRVQGALLCVSCRMDVKEEKLRLLEAEVQAKCGVAVWRYRSPFRFR